jgi:hypothetical protein
MEEAQATGEAFSLQKRTPSTVKYTTSSLFSGFGGHFALLYRDPANQNQCGSLTQLLADENLMITSNFVGVRC